MEFFFQKSVCHNSVYHQLYKHILNGRNVALFARRRLGKLHPGSLQKFDEIRSYSRN